MSNTYTPERAIEAVEEVTGEVIDATKQIVVASQVAHPWKAVARTIVQVVIPLVIVIGAIIPALVESVPTWDLPADFEAKIMPALLAISAFVTAMAAILAKVMANPSVNSILTKISLGATPKSGTTDDGTEANDEGTQDADEEDFDIDPSLAETTDEDETNDTEAVAG